MNTEEIIDHIETDKLKRSTAETSMRICQICLSPIVELKKASYLEAQAGLRILVHDSCLANIVEAVSQHEQEQREREKLLQSIKRTVRG